MERDVVEEAVRKAKEKKTQPGLPYHSIILGAIGGLLAVFITICMTVTIRQRSIARSNRARRSRSMPPSEPYKPTPALQQRSKDSSERSATPSPELSRLLDASQLDRLNGNVPPFTRDQRSSLTPPVLPPCKPTEPAFEAFSGPSQYLQRTAPLELHVERNFDVLHNHPRGRTQDLPLGEQLASISPIALERSGGSRLVDPCVRGPEE